MNNNQNIGRKPGDAMKIGAIIAVVVGSIALIIGTLFSIITILMVSFANTTTVGFDDSPPIHSGTFLYQFSIFILIFSLLNIPSIVINILLLNGKLKSSIIPSIFAIIGLGIGLIGIVCGILILLGKFEDEIDVNSNENFWNKNFNISKWTTKAKQRKSNYQSEQNTVTVPNTVIDNNELKEI